VSLETSPAGTAESVLPRESSLPATPFEPPGGILVWIIVFLEVITFAAGLVVFVVQGRTDAAAFQAGRALLNQPVALVNTLVLLTGGWCMANGIAMLRRGERISSRRWIGGAIGSGFVFLTLKCFEYAEKLQHGIGFGDDTFFTLYWLLTGFHFLHVIVGVVLLLVMHFAIGRGKYHRDNLHDVESSGIFWHLCDLLWLLLYPVIYLVR
jgi:nitric oxide reductase NorE protein